MMETASSQLDTPPPAAAAHDDGWRTERDLDVIKREIRKARHVYVYTDFNAAVRLGRQAAIELLDGKHDPVYANMSSGPRVSIFIHKLIERDR